MKTIIFGENTDLMAKVLDLQLQRQNLVMANITNVNTPKYRPRQIEFEKDMQNALALDERSKVTRTSERHLPAEFDPTGFAGRGLKEFQPRIVHGQDTVDLDKEMSVMAKNTMLYNAITEIINKDFQGINKIINEGSR